MICNAILYFTLVFSDGHKEKREKYVDVSTAIHLIDSMQHDPKTKEELKKEGVVDTRDFRIVETDPYSCISGPVIVT